MRALRTLPVRFLLAALLVPLHAASGADSASSSLTGTDLLGRMVDAYRSCRTYRDEGLVRTEYLSDGSRRIQERPFTTAFVRPDFFRFQFKDSYPSGRTMTYVVWQRGPDVATWWDTHDGVEKPPSLDLALAGATGVSGGSAHTVPSLLLPGIVTGRSLASMTAVQRLEDQACGKATCARIQGQYAGSQRTLWIELGRFVLRRIDSATAFPTFRTVTTTTYEPIVDEPIPPEILAFNPPRP